MACDIDIPKEPNVGDALTADWGRKVVKCLRSLRPIDGRNVRTRTTSLGTVISADGGVAKSEARAAAKPLLPFAVRHHRNADDEAKSEWQIYIPKGCATLVQGVGFETRGYVAANDDGDTGEELNDGWFRLDLAEGDSDILRLDQSLGNRVARRWEVWASFMPWPIVKAGSAKVAGAAEWKKVANVWEVSYSGESDEGAGESVERRVEQLFTGTVEVTRDISSAFSIEYALDDYEAKEPAVTARIVNQRLRVGRLYKEIAEPTQLPSGAKSAWARVDHADETVALSVVFDPEGTEAESDDDKTVVKLYSLDADGGEGGVPFVKEDSRETLDDLPFYTNAPDTSDASSGDAEA